MTIKAQLCLQAAANVSIVRGTLSEQRAQAMSARGRPVDKGAPYAAAALSLVFHAASPVVPTLRADVRLFQVVEFAHHKRKCCPACQHGVQGRARQHELSDEI